MIFNKFAREFVIASERNDEFLTPFLHFPHTFKKPLTNDEIPTKKI